MSKNNLSTEPYKGVRDFYPEDQALLNYLVSTYRSVCERYGYVEYHASILEPSELYKAKGADNEEIINEQTYTFTDRGGREVTLRPEMTPTVARMVSAKRRDMGFPLRLFSIPNVFRYERPQRGRLREHWQLNVDIFGTKNLAADAEIIQVAYEVMRAFGAREEDYIIRINSRTHLNTLIERLGITNPQVFFGLLDRKDKMTEQEFAQKLSELGVTPAQIFDTETPADVAEVLATLTTLGIGNAIFDPTIVRGFSYYSGIVFEVMDTHPQNNRAMFGGGRYDNLTALFDEEPIAGVGFGMGDVTIRDFLEVRGLLPTYVPPTKVYVGVVGNVTTDALVLADELRAQGVAVGVDFGDKKLGDQIKTAVKHKIPWLMVVGADELASGTFGVKNLNSGTEEKLSRDQLAQFFLNV